VPSKKTQEYGIAADTYQAAQTFFNHQRFFSVFLNPAPGGGETGFFLDPCYVPKAFSGGHAGLQEAGNAGSQAGVP